VIPLSYGEDVQWVKNVLVAGQARLRYHDRDLVLHEPRVADLEELVHLLPPGLAAQYRRLRYDRVLAFEVAGEG
jgi:hypothetical protein